MDLLSICIPTHNRKEQLLHLLKHIKKYNIQNWKTIVIDNASNDGTYEMMQEFIKDQNFIYCRNPRNLGWDGNFVRVLEEGKKYSRYSLWLGDDDIPEPIFFSNMSNILNEFEPNIVMLNGTDYASGNILMEYEKDFLEEEIIQSLKLLIYTVGIGWGNYVVDNSLIDMTKTMKYYGTTHLPWGAMVELLIDQQKEKGKTKLYIASNAYIRRSTAPPSYTYSHTLFRACCSVSGALYALYPIEAREIARTHLKNLIFNGWADGYQGEVWESYVNMLVAQGEVIDESRPLSIHELDYSNNYFSSNLSLFSKGDFIIFGAGNFGMKCLKIFGNKRDLIRCFIDNDAKKYNTDLFGIPIQSPMILRDETLSKYIIVAMSKEKWNSAKLQLQEIGLNGKEVLTIESFQLRLFGDR